MRIYKSFRYLNTYTIPTNSKTIYTFKIDSNYYYLQRDKFIIPYPNNLFKFNYYIFLKLFYNQTALLLLK